MKGVYRRGLRNRLNQYLHRVKVIESPMCECGLEPETVRHFLFQCPQWTNQRTQMQEALGHRWGDQAFGAWSGRLNTKRTIIDGPKKSRKPNLKVIKAVIHFATTTGRLVPKAWLNYNEDSTERERREIDENNL